MVAGCLRELGFFMGDIVADNHEDPEFISDDVEPLKHLILQRNLTHRDWGWKVPKTIFQIHELIPFIRNPHFIVLTRDPFDVAESMQQRTDFAFELGVEHVFMVYHYLENFIERCVSPLAFVSYNRAMKYPDQFMQEICYFLNLNDLPAETIAQARDFILTPGYRATSKDHNLAIRLDHFSVEPSSPSILQDISERSRRLLHWCKLELEKVQEIVITLDTMSLPETEYQIWQAGISQILHFQSEIQLLYQEINGTRVDLPIAKQLYCRSKQLLEKIMQLQWLGSQLIYVHTRNID